jgi:hypothetical protein
MAALLGRVEDHGCGPLHHGGGVSHRNVTRQTHEHAPVRQRLYHLPYTKHFIGNEKSEKDFLQKIQINSTNFYWFFLTSDIWGQQATSL